MRLISFPAVQWKYCLHRVWRIHVCVRQRDPFLHHYAMSLLQSTEVVFSFASPLRALYVGRDGSIKMNKT